MCEQPPLLSRHSFISKTKGGWLRYTLGISMQHIQCRRCMDTTCWDSQGSIIQRGSTWWTSPRVKLCPWIRSEYMERATQYWLHAGQMCHNTQCFIAWMTDVLSHCQLVVDHNISYACSIWQKKKKQYKVVSLIHKLCICAWYSITVKKEVNKN